MSYIPHELITIIGDFLAPKYRCRLFMCRREWYFECYGSQSDLFKWFSNNKNNITNINKISYEESHYTQTYIDGYLVHVSVRTVPHWGNKRALWKIHCRGHSCLYLRSHKFSFNDEDLEGGHIRYDNNPNKTHFRYGMLLNSHYLHKLDDDTEVVKILFNNFDIIIKHLNIYDVFKFWLSLGFRYYYALRRTHSKLCLCIKKYTKDSTKMKKKFMKHGIDIRL